MDIQQWLLSNVKVEGVSSVHPLPSSIASVKYYKLHEITQEQPVNAFTDKIMSVAPVGFSIPNPVNVSFNTPRTQQVTRGVREVRETNAPEKRCNK